MQVAETPLNHRRKRKRKSSIAKSKEAVTEPSGNDFHDTPDECEQCGEKGKFNAYGKRKTKKLGVKQRWQCKRCGYIFVANEAGFEKVSFDPPIIVLAIDLIFDGLSYRKCARRITVHYGLERPLHHTSVLKWVNKYMSLIKSYVDILVPRLSGKWHADEMMVNVKDTKPIKRKGRYEWLWNLMSSEERFLIASIISKHRGIEDARKLFAQGKALARTKPDEVITDWQTSYPTAIKKEFHTLSKPRPVHRRYHSIQRNPNNNRIERLHNTKREKLKVMRGLDNKKSAQRYADYDRINYNFSRPHMGLKGKTPAEAAGMNLGLGQNGRLDLITQSARAKKLRPEEKFKAALGNRLEKVEVIDEKDCIKIKPKTWLNRRQWKEVNNILRTFDFEWSKNGKGSLWIKQKAINIQKDRMDAYF